MEESKELQGTYKIFRAVIYVSLLMEFFEYAMEPEMLDHWSGILCELHGRIKQWFIYQEGHLIYSKVATVMVICITCIGTRNKKNLEFDARRQVLYPLVGGIGLLVTAVWLFGYPMEFRLYGLRLNIILYMVASLLGTVLVHVALDNISKFLKEGLLKDRFNLENESFEQCRTLQENRYFVNIPMRYYYKGKFRKGWVNVVNPFRGIWVVGTPGSGKTSNIDIARSWIEQWVSELDGQRAYTKRIYGQDGLILPWVYPYNGFDGYHTQGLPMHTYGQMHQGAYYVRMAADVANVLQDDAWTKANLIPILQGVAEFYGNIASKHNDGLWHFYNEPSCGQDEFGGDNHTDYIDVLYSAQYVMQQAVAHGIDPDGRYSQILNDGIAFPALLDPMGNYYYAYLDGEGTWGRQKHPAQLNELLYTPCYNAPTHQAAYVYKHRNEMTVDANKPFYWGWTLGSFLLAGSRLGLVDEWSKDWDNMAKSDYVDKEWIQSFETSTHWTMAYYNINNGLIAQSLLNNLVCDWYGRLEIGKCNPWQGKQYIKDITSQLGVIVNGTVEGQTYDVTLTAWKDCDFTIYDEHQVNLKKGESRNFTGTIPIAE